MRALAAVLVCLACPSAAQAATRTEASFRREMLAQCRAGFGPGYACRYRRTDYVRCRRHVCEGSVHWRHRRERGYCEFVGTVRRGRALTSATICQPGRLP